MTTFGGLWITPDVATKVYWERLFRTDEKTDHAIHMLYDAVGRDIVTNAFDDADDARMFFINHGFAINEYTHSHFLGVLSSAQHMDPVVVAGQLEGRTTFALTPHH